MRRLHAGLSITLALLAPSLVTAQHIITTYAGGGPRNIPASIANISPRSILVDPGGNVFVAARDQQRVFRIDAATGILSLVAGDGTAGFAGDSGPAVAARLNAPYSVAMDGTGRLYIADCNNHRIRRVDFTTGVISTVAGTGSTAFNGDGIHATSANLWCPQGIAIDASDRLFIADSSHHRIRRVNLATGIITTYAGIGVAGSAGDGGLATAATLNNPHTLAVDAAGGVYVMASSTHRVRRIHPTTGIITTVAGTGTQGFSGDGGPAINAMFNNPTHVAIDATGRLWIADISNNRVRRVDLAGNVTTVAGTGTAGFSGDGGPAISAMLSGPTNLAFDANGHLLIVDFVNLRIRRFDAATGIVTTFAGNGTNFYGGDGWAAVDGSMFDVNGVALDPWGSVYIADRSNHRVRRVDPTTGIITTVAGNGTQGLTPDGGAAASAALSLPRRLAVDASGRVYFTDGDVRVRTIDPSTGILTTVAGNGSSAYSGDGGSALSAGMNVVAIALDHAGHLFIGGNNRVRQVDLTTGVITTVAGTGAASSTGDGGPATAATVMVSGLATDSANHLFISGGNRVRRVDAATGIITPVAGTGVSGYNGDGIAATSAHFGNATGLGVTASALYVADAGNHRIRRIDRTTGIITSVAGTGVLGFSGDGGLAAAASVASPSDVAVSPSSVVFFSDTSNRRVRRIASPNTAPAANAGANQTAEATSLSGASITLDGSGSSDPDGDTLSYEWRNAANAIVGSAASVTLTLPIGSHVLTLTVDDGHSGPASDQVTIVVRDTTVPSIALLSPGGPYALHQQVAASFTCHDTASPIASCVGTVADGAFVDTASAGTRTFTVAAEDAAGNKASLDLVYTTNKGIPVITWAAPSAITFGTALSAAQLNASASVPGAWSYTPSIGTQLAAGGGQPLSVTFVPNDTANYEHAAAAVTIDVLKAVPVVLTSLASYTYDGTAHHATGLAHGVGGAGDVLTPVVTFTYAGTGATSYPTSSMAPAAAGTYEVVGHFAGNASYVASDSAPVAFTIGRASQTITFGELGNKTWGDADFAVAASATSGLPVSFNIVSGPATISDAMIHLTGSGKVVVRASRGGNGNYHAAAPVDRSFTVHDVITRAGFYQPVSPVASFLNPVKGGSSVPLKFEVFVNGEEKTDTAGLRFSVAQIACTGGTEVPLAFVTSGGSSLRYDTAEGRFILNWQTPRGEGSCFVVRMTTADDGSLSALFKLR